jgi:hypothetical protein
MMSAYIANLLVRVRRDDLAAAKAFPIDLRQVSTENGISVKGHSGHFAVQSGCPLERKSEELIGSCLK